MLTRIAIAPRSRSCRSKDGKTHPRTIISWVRAMETHRPTRKRQNDRRRTFSEWPVGCAAAPGWLSAVDDRYARDERTRASYPWTRQNRDALGVCSSVDLTRSLLSRCFRAALTRVWAAPNMFCESWTDASTIG